MEKVKSIGLILFLLITSGVYLYTFAPTIRSEHLTVIFKDPTIPSRVDLETNEDHGTTHIKETRMFHNKLLLGLNNAFVNVSQGLDPVFLFSLSSDTFFPDNNEQTHPVLPAIEFPFFVIAGVVLIRKWNKRYTFLLWMIGISLGIQALFLPILNPLKLLPIVISVQTITFLGTWEAVYRVKKDCGVRNNFFAGTKRR